MLSISHFARGAAVVAAVAVSMPALADEHHFHAFLDGIAETPPNASPATGFADLTVDPVTFAFSIHMEFSGLVAPQTAAHIHAAPPGVAGGVIIPLTFGSPSDTAGIMSAANYASMLAGNTYVNVHSTNFPGGEIRGQLIKIPAPSSLALLGLGGLVALRRRR